MPKQITLDGPEAGLLLASLVAAADDDPSPPETAVLRRYFTRGTAESLEARLTEAGLSWPKDAKALEEPVLAGLMETDDAFRQRSMAVALELALVDGTVDQAEMRLLSRYALALGLSMADADLYRKYALKEVESATGYGVIQPLDLAAVPLDIDIGPRETAAALVCLVAAADDDPSDAEMAFIREYCRAEDFESLIGKIRAAGGAWPADLARCKHSILRGLKAQDRRGRLRTLTLAYRTAAADGAVEPEELAILGGFCVELEIGLGELEACAPALESLYRSE